MFALKSWARIAIHALVIAVISFNAAVPTKALVPSGSAFQPTNNDYNARNAHGQELADLMANFDQLPISFVPNMGQEEDDGVRFLAQGLGGNLFFTPEEVVFSLFNPVEVPSETPEKEKKNIRYDLRPASVLRITYVDASTQPEITGIEALPGVANYLIGTDSSKWHANTPTYSGISYHELYPGIEMRYEGTDGSLKSSFHVAPGANPAAILWKYKGADQVTIDEFGSLVIALPLTRSW